jgi:hypothetical protein
VTRRTRAVEGFDAAEQALKTEFKHASLRFTGRQSVASEERLSESPIRVLNLWKPAPARREDPVQFPFKFRCVRPTVSPRLDLDSVT